MEISRRFKAAIAATLLVGGAWAANGVVSSAGAETGAAATRGATAITYHRDAPSRGGDGVKVQALGDMSAADGTFHPLDPCRIVDTSGSGDGALAAGEERPFWGIDFGGGFGDQGGSLVTCGVPLTATALQVNVAAKNPTAKGFLRLYPYDTAMPTSGFLNYVSGVNISNAGVVPICRTAIALGLCDYDFNVYSSKVTDVIVDVMGYYEGPMMVRVNADGTIAAASAAVLTVEKGVIFGEFKVTFDRDVSACVYMAIPDPHAIDLETGEVSTALWAVDEPESVYVHTADSDGTWAFHSFSLVVHC